MTDAEVVRMILNYGPNANLNAVEIASTVAFLKRIGFSWEKAN